MKTVQKQYKNSTILLLNEFLRKRLHHFLWLILIFTLSCAKESKEVPLDSFLSLQTENRVGCPDITQLGCPTFTLVRNFLVDGCPTVTIVTYSVCINGITFNAPIWVYGQGADCDKLKKKISDAYKTPFIGPDLALQIINSIETSISLQAQDAIIKAVANTPLNTFNCTSTPCNPINKTISAQTSDCLRLCATFDPSGEDGGIWNLSTVVCGTGCCSRRTPFCIKPDKSICYGPVTKMELGSCEPTTNSCPLGSVPGATCSPPCDRL
jgi:hypothetical protein